MTPPAGSLAYDPTRAALLRPGDAPGFSGWMPGDELTLCAELSRLAYSTDATSREDALARVGLEISGVFDEGATHAFLATGRSATFLVFRGTRSDDPTNLIDDALAVFTEWPSGGRVHTGFARALDRVWPAVAAALRRASGRVVVTGHSLGGSMATLTAARARPARLVTIGSPRVGDETFARGLERSLGGERITRVVNCCDAVCGVPLRPYRHVARPLYLDRHGARLEGASLTTRLADGAAARLSYLAEHARGLANVPVRDLADHAPVNYVTALRARAPHTDGLDEPMESS